MKAKDFFDAHRIHIIGIKGWGTSALAQMLSIAGYSVCGSDTPEHFKTDDLLSQHPSIRVEEFSDTLHENIDAVVYSTGWLSHPELEAARRRKIPTVSYPEAIAHFFNNHYGVAVCGTHGKTTTSAWIAYTLKTLGEDISAIIGSTVKQLGVNSLSGTSTYFILEADEYQDKLAHYDPKLAVFTSVDYDHPDFFKSPKEYSDCFATFAKKIVSYKGKVVACWEDEGVRTALAQCEQQVLIRYGFDTNLDYAAPQINEEEAQTHFSLFKKGQHVAECTIKPAGSHNVLNALAVIAAVDQLGIATLHDICAAVGKFEGATRRFEYRPLLGSTIVIDDYAHHPTEVQATLRAARKRYPGKKIWCVFRPHSFSRTESLFSDFSKSFSDADTAVVVDIFGSVRERQGAVSSQDLVDAIQKESGNAFFGGTPASTFSLVQKHLSEIDILITMGAEDLWKEWMPELSK